MNLKINKILVLCLSMLTALEIQASDIKHFGATLFFADGTNTKFSSVTSAPGYSVEKGRDSLAVLLNGEPLKVPVSGIKEMTFINHSGNDYDIDLKLRNGKSFIVSIDVSHIWLDVYGNKINPLTNKIANLRFSWDGKSKKRIKKIIFSEDVGESRINPTTKSIWPSYYNYDPKTGEKLMWKKIK